MLFLTVVIAAVVMASGGASAAPGTTEVTLTYDTVSEVRGEGGDLQGCFLFASPSSVTSDSPIPLYLATMIRVFVLEDRVFMPPIGGGQLGFDAGSVFLLTPPSVVVADVNVCDGLSVSFEAGAIWRWFGWPGDRDAGTAQVEMEFHDGGATVRITLPFVVEPYPDQDADGVWDSIQTARGRFDDGSGTFGSIPTGQGIRVADVDPGGVLVEYGGYPHDFTVDACGYDLRFASSTAPASAVITCGSVTVTPTSGTVTIAFGSGNSATVGAGGSVRISEPTTGSFRVDNLGATPVTLVVDGQSSELTAGDTWLPGPRSRDDCRNGGWQRFGYKNQGRCIADVVRR